jgi:hypothetical protein
VPEATGAHSIVVCANGALLYDVDEHAVIDHAPIKSGLAVELVTHLRQDAPGCTFACEMTFTFGRDRNYPTRMTTPDDTLIGDVAEMVADRETTKLIVRDDAIPHDELVRIVQGIVGQRAEVTHSGYGIVEISASGVDKGRGLRVACARHGIDIADVTKINIKGVYQVWTRDGGYHEVPLKLFHPYTREGCKLCPDFAAEHADISCGGIGSESGWTLTVVRTARGEEWMKGVIDEGLIEAKPGESDPVAMNLLVKLSKASRKRWPSDSLSEERRAPGLLPIVPSAG